VYIGFNSGLGGTTTTDFDLAGEGGKNAPLPS